MRCATRRPAACATGSTWLTRSGGSRIEYDGRQHAENAAQWRWDVQRREDLDADGWRLVVVLSGDLYRSPARTLERIVTAARAQGVSLRLRRDEWRRYFPQRD